MGQMNLKSRMCATVRGAEKSRVPSGVGSRSVWVAPGFWFWSVPVLFVLFPALSAAQIPEGVEGPYRPNVVAERAISKIQSPWCPGLMLEVCPAPESRALRDSIHGLALEGWTEGQIVDWVIANHGERYLAVPRGRGTGLWAWVMPPVVLLLGAGVLVTFLRRSRPPRELNPEDSDLATIREDELDLLAEAVREADRAEE